MIVKWWDRHWDHWECCRHVKDEKVDAICKLADLCMRKAVAFVPKNWTEPSHTSHTVSFGAKSWQRGARSDTQQHSRAILRLECLTQNGHVKPNETMSHITFLLTISFGTIWHFSCQEFETVAVFHIGRRLFDWLNPTWKSWSRTQSAAESRARSKVLSLHLLDGQPHHWLQMSNGKLRVSERNGFQK